MQHPHSKYLQTVSLGNLQAVKRNFMRICLRDISLTDFLSRNSIDMQHRAYRGEGECLEGTITLFPHGENQSC